jgi:hypothetical protein
VHIKLLDDSGWAAEVCAAAGWKVLVIRAASYWRYNDVQPGDLYHTHPLAQEQQIEPTALNNQVACRANRGKIGRGVATQGEACGDEARVGEVSAAVMIDLDLAGENLLQQWLNLAIAIRPM